MIINYPVGDSRRHFIPTSLHVRIYLCKWHSDVSLLQYNKSAVFRENCNNLEDFSGLIIWRRVLPVKDLTPSISAVLSFYTYKFNDYNIFFFLSKPYKNKYMYMSTKGTFVELVVERRNVLCKSALKKPTNESYVLNKLIHAFFDTLGV